MISREKLAQLWHARAKVRRLDIFAADDAKLRPISKFSQSDVAVPGMVGGAYRRGGLAIVSVNPAGGKDDFRPTAGDAALYRAAESIQHSDAVDYFEEMNRAYEFGMLSWGAQWQHIKRILEMANQSLSQLAYPYLVPFRSRNDEGSRLSQDIVARGYQTGFVDILSELQLALVVPVDRHSEAAVQRLKAETGMTFDIIYYTRQQNAHTAREATLAKIADHPLASV